MLYQETNKGVVNMVQYRNNMKDFREMNVKVYKVEDISMPGAYFLDFGATVNIMRKGCNQYGNPKYHLYMESEYMDKIQATKKRFGKVFTDKKNGLRYLSFTSYNIGSDLRLLFKLCGFIED